MRPHGRPLPGGLGYREPIHSGNVGPADEGPEGPPQHVGPGVGRTAESAKLTARRHSTRRDNQRGLTHEPASHRLHHRRRIVGYRRGEGLHERGVPFDCFEKSDRVGGNWVFGNKNGMSAAYRELFINTSRERMEYSDFPMPKSYPDFPTTPTSASTSTTTSTTSASARGSPSRPASSMRGAWRAAAGRSRSRAGRCVAMTPWSWPTATTGTRAGPSPPSRARTPSPACRCTPTPTPTTTSSPTATSSCWAWATAPWTSPSRPATWRATPTWRRGAARGSCPST